MKKKCPIGVPEDFPFSHIVNLTCKKINWGNFQMQFDKTASECGLVSNLVFDVSNCKECENKDDIYPICCSHLCSKHDEDVWFIGVRHNCNLDCVEIYAKK